MIDSSDIAQIRFGLGRSPVITSPRNADDILDSLSRFDADAATLPVPVFAESSSVLLENQMVNRALREAREAEDEALIKKGEEERKALFARIYDNHRSNFVTLIARGVVAEDGMRERLSRFWSDHFTVRAKGSRTIHLVAAYVEEAIRPHITGRFSDMLWAAVTHPMMLFYLDQSGSVGPNSEIGQRRSRGLNENLAREMIELHTLGVGADYTQTDVRELAELLTGLTYDPRRGFRFDSRLAEPGAETVLGQTYHAVADLSVIRDVVDDLARHPDTADHIARKLAVHFVSDTPSEALVDYVSTVFNQTEGDMMAVYDALVSHPDSWKGPLQKVKQPHGYVTSALRALGVEKDAILALDRRDARRYIQDPMQVMGQDWEKPVGPDGWPEEAEAWITPQGMAGRIGWAMRAPQFFTEELPDPRDLADIALGSTMDDNVQFAASAAQDRREGVAVVLASAAFQRR